MHGRKSSFTLYSQIRHKLNIFTVCEVEPPMSDGLVDNAVDDDDDDVVFAGYRSRSTFCTAKNVNIDGFIRCR